MEDFGPPKLWDFFSRISLDLASGGRLVFSDLGPQLEEKGQGCYKLTYNILGPHKKYDYV